MVSAHRDIMPGPYHQPITETPAKAETRARMMPLITRLEDAGLEPQFFHIGGGNAAIWFRLSDRSHLVLTDEGGTISSPSSPDWLVGLYAEIDGQVSEIVDQVDDEDLVTHLRTFIGVHRVPTPAGLAYSAAIRQAEGMYQELINRLSRAFPDGDVHLAQTGGMCLAIGLTINDRYLLVASEDGPLPWEPEEAETYNRPMHDTSFSVGWHPNTGFIEFTVPDRHLLSALEVLSALTDLNKE